MRALTHPGHIRFRFAVSDVVGDGVREQKVILLYKANVLSERLQLMLFHIHSIDQNTTLLYIVKPAQQCNQCAFARTRCSHDSHSLAGLDFETDVPEHQVIAVGKGDMVKQYVPPEFFRADCVLILPDGGTQIHIIKYLLTAGHGLCGCINDVGQLSHWVGEHPDIAGHADQLTNVHVAQIHHQSATRQGDGRAELAEHIHKGHVI